MHRIINNTLYLNCIEILNMSVNISGGSFANGEIGLIHGQVKVHSFSISQPVIYNIIILSFILGQ